MTAADRDTLYSLAAIIDGHGPSHAQQLAIADAILKSEWLAQRDRRVAAQAWDEGRESGITDEQQAHRRSTPTLNPYRADTTEGTP